eukprot:4512782-Pyramimonas_sp.AAC.1
MASAISPPAFETTVSSRPNARRRPEDQYANHAAGIARSLQRVSTRHPTTSIRRRRSPPDGMNVVGQRSNMLTNRRTSRDCTSDAWMIQRHRDCAHRPQE